MRLYCFSSVSLIPPNDEKSADFIPYEKDSDEIRIAEFAERRWTIKNILRESETPSPYRLTEICIGYKYERLKESESPIVSEELRPDMAHRLLPSDEGKEVKVYFINLYRKDNDLITIPMLRGFVSISDVPEEDNVFDIKIATSKIFQEKVEKDLLIRIRCIKNTGIKGKISEEEEEIYEEYEKKIKEFFGSNIEDREKVFEAIPFKLPDTKTAKPLKQKITDLKTLIDLLCNPQNGSFKNIPPWRIVIDSEGKEKRLPCRFDQKLDCLLQKTGSWIISHPRYDVIETQSKFHYGCRSLNWQKIDLKNVTFKDIQLKECTAIKFLQVRIFENDGILFPCLQKMNFGNLTSLTLISCNIKELSDCFLENLSPNLKTLILEKNDITFISKAISNLKKLQIFNLNSNVNLSDDRIPWSFFPRRIKSLSLEETNIRKISNRIKKLYKLEKFKASSNRLKFVSWEDISPTIEILWIKGNPKRKSINHPDLEHKKKLTHLRICDAGLRKIDCSKLPSSLKELFLTGNKLTTFDTKTFLSHLQYLHLDQNRLKYVNWENLPQSLMLLMLEYNHLDSIGNITHLSNLSAFVAKNNLIKEISVTNLFEDMFLSWVDLSENQLSQLPIGFENWENLTDLNLNNNKFCYSNDIENGLWKRLPMGLRNLGLANNDIKIFPCDKNGMLESLNLSGCNLQCLCPFLYSRLVYGNGTKTITLLNNQELNHLPFIPTTIYQPPTFKGEQQNIVYYKSALTVETDNENFRDTTKFPRKLTKPIYDFKLSDIPKTKYYCNCCAYCSRETEEEMVEQLMVMDFDLKIIQMIQPIAADKTVGTKTVNQCDISESRDKINAKEPETSESINFQEPDVNNECNAIGDKNTFEESSFKNLSKQNNEKIPWINPDKENSKQKLYSPGQWKTKVITRLCERCKNLLINDTNLAFEEFKKAGVKESIPYKRKRQEESYIKDTEEHQYQNLGANEQMSYLPNETYLIMEHDFPASVAYQHQDLEMSQINISLASQNLSTMNCLSPLQSLQQFHQPPVPSMPSFPQYDSYCEPHETTVFNNPSFVSNPSNYYVSETDDVAFVEQQSNFSQCPQNFYQNSMDFTYSDNAHQDLNNYSTPQHSETQLINSVRNNVQDYPTQFSYPHENCYQHQYPPNQNIIQHNSTLLLNNNQNTTTSLISSEMNAYNNVQEVYQHQQEYSVNQDAYLYNSQPNYDSTFSNIDQNNFITMTPTLMSAQNITMPESAFYFENN